MLDLSISYCNVSGTHKASHYWMLGGDSNFVSLPVVFFVVLFVVVSIQLRTKGRINLLKGSPLSALLVKPDPMPRS